ncbi:hypothetical protein ACFL0U_03280 [Pseudomonadota bacterium]
MKTLTKVILILLSIIIVFWLVINNIKENKEEESISTINTQIEGLQKKIEAKEKQNYCDEILSPMTNENFAFLEECKLEKYSDKISYKDGYYIIHTDKNGDIKLQQRYKNYKEYPEEQSSRSGTLVFLHYYKDIDYLLFYDMTGMYDSEAYYFSLINRKTGEKFLQYCWDLDISQDNKWLAVTCSPYNTNIDRHNSISIYRITDNGLLKENSFTSLECASRFRGKNYNQEKNCACNNVNFISNTIVQYAFEDNEYSQCNIERINTKWVSTNELKKVVTTSLFDERFSKSSLAQIDKIREDLKNNPNRLEELNKRTYGYNQGVINFTHEINNK